MNIQLTPEQESLIQAKIQTGKYKSAQEVVAIALQLLTEYEQGETEWTREVRQKIEAAIRASESTPPIDGEAFISDILERFKGA